ncbi:MAG: hypothetical protein V3V13_07195 [Paracoccaceae bacterium]
MIITLPRHVAQSADLSARARIPALSRLLIAGALALARLDDRISTPRRLPDLSDHLARDIGLDHPCLSMVTYQPIRPVIGL